MIKIALLFVVVFLGSLVFDYFVTQNYKGKSLLPQGISTVLCIILFSFMGFSWERIAIGTVANLAAYAVLRKNFVR